MNEPPVSVLEAESEPTKCSVRMRTFTALAGRCKQMYFLSGPTSLLEVLQKHRPDVALCSIPVLQPDATVTVDNLHERVPDAALILWMDAADKEIAARCIQAGAKD